MKKTAIQCVVGLTLLAGVPVASGYVNDLPAYQPAWRGQTGSTLQQWAFTTSSGGEFSYVDLGVTASPFTNPSGTPTADVVAQTGGVGWVAGDNADYFANGVAFSTNGVGWWDLGFSGGGHVTLTIPGASGPADSVRCLSIQITEAIESGYYDPASVTVMGGTQIGGDVTTQIEVYNNQDTGQRNNFVQVRKQFWQVPGNTTSDTITITGATTGGNDSVIGGIVVDTLVDRPPVPGVKAATTTQNVAATISVQKLWSVATDPDGDPITFMGPVAVSAQGGSVINSTLEGQPAVTYTPPVDFVGADQFYYNITDGKAVSTGTVTVTVKPATGITFNMLPLVMSNNFPFVQFAGVRGLTYELQRSPTLSPPSWSTIATISLPANGTGIGSYYDTSPPTNAFYRTHLP